MHVQRSPSRAACAPNLFRVVPQYYASSPPSYRAMADPPGPVVVSILWHTGSKYVGLTVAGEKTFGTRGQTACLLGLRVGPCTHHARATWGGVRLSSPICGDVRTFVRPRWRSFHHILSRSSGNDRCMHGLHEGQLGPQCVCAGDELTFLLGQGMNRLLLASRLVEWKVFGWKQGGMIRGGSLHDCLCCIAGAF
ncbi:hypothetical protein FA95DRAFT_1140129 [Auriscalpium vulgare]|uniref:Uncharacterized protein n=1 Tax=Auriscalpium vulgare TaxID=40419 RepID=A0ACB8RVY7_9AGAM|nr:hypothetical protein FA95DRAFT_1140129 [Auriscalpium vulgare]